MAEFIEVAEANEIPPGGMKVVMAEGQEILLANIEGTVHAINRRCGHMNAPLEDGVLKGKEVICPMHGVRFDVTTGKKLCEPIMAPPPGADKLPQDFVEYMGKLGLLIAKISTLDCQAYAVRVEGESVQVSV
jgi:nitrite reductase/ring-hydroxylating ferredoxin subunit